MACFRQILFRVKLLFSRVRPCANQSSETPYIDRLSATDSHAFSCRKAQTIRARSFQKSIVASNAFASIAQLSHLCPLYLRRNFYVNYTLPVRSVFLLSKSTCFCLLCIKHNLQLCNIRPSIAFRKKPTKRYWSLFQATTLYGSNFGRIDYSHASMVVRLMFFADFWFFNIVWFFCFPKILFFSSSLIF